MKIHLTGLLLCTFLVACEKPAEPDNTPTAQMSSEDKQTGHKHQSGYTKPGASVEIVGEKRVYLQPGETLDWVLSLSSAESSGELHATLSTSEGLELVSNQREFDFKLTSKGAYAMPVTVRALNEGRYYLYVQAQVSAEGRTSSRALAVAVQVGDAKPSLQRDQNKRQLDSEGRELLIQDAQEVISD